MIFIIKKLLLLCTGNGMMLEPPKHVKSKDFQRGWSVKSLILCSILELVRTHFVPTAVADEEVPPRKFGKAAEPHR